MSLYLGENLLASGGSSAFKNNNIGEIIQSTIPLTDAGLHLLDGSLISGSGAYSAFVDYIAGLVSNYPDLFTTEANWQTSVTNYGACGKFVYDSVNNTVRLPKITGFTEGTTDVTALGDLIQAGLPNITGYSAWACDGFCDRGYSSQGSAYNKSSGALYATLDGGAFGMIGASGGDLESANTRVNIDASRSSSIYGNSATVQPQSIKVLYYIVIATSVKTNIEVDIDEIATDLNGKADVDLTNCTKPHIVETYVNGTSWYRVYSDGWCEQGGRTGVITGGGSINVSFLKNYLPENITVISTSVGAYTAAGEANSPITSITTTGFTQSSGNISATTTYSWYACGYIS